jgi:hypothetical protein
MDCTSYGGVVVCVYNVDGAQACDVLLFFSSEVALDGWDERTTVYYFAPEDGFSSVLDVLVGTGNCNLCFV